MVLKTNYQLTGMTQEQDCLKLDNINHLMQHLMQLVEIFTLSL